MKEVISFKVIHWVCMFYSLVTQCLPIHTDYPLLTRHNQVVWIRMGTMCGKRWRVWFEEWNFACPKSWKRRTAGQPQSLSFICSMSFGLKSLKEKNKRKKVPLGNREFLFWFVLWGTASTGHRGGFQRWLFGSGIQPVDRDWMSIGEHDAVVVNPFLRLTY